MEYDDWTSKEAELHQEGRRLMQQARSQRKNRIEYEKIRAERIKREALDAQRKADEDFEKREAENIKLFMSGISNLLAQYDLTMSPVQVVSDGEDVPIFKLVTRSSYRRPYYTVSLRPGVGWNWSK